MLASDGTHHCKSGFQEVTHSSGATLGLCVTILDTSKLEKALGCRGGDDASTMWCGGSTLGMSLFL